MTAIKEWLTATGRDLDQHFTTARGKLTHAHRVASEKVTPVAHRAVENVGSAYQAAKPRVEAAVVYAAPHVKHGVKYAAIRVLRFIINAEPQFLDYVETHLPKEDKAGPPLTKPSSVEPVALPQARISAADDKNEDEGGNGLAPSSASLPRVQPPARPPVQQPGGEALLQPVQGQGLGLDAGDPLQGEHHGQVHREQGR